MKGDKYVDAEDLEIGDSIRFPNGSVATLAEISDWTDNSGRKVRECVSTDGEKFVVRMGNYVVANRSKEGHWYTS